LNSYPASSAPIVCLPFRFMPGWYILERSKRKKRSLKDQVIPYDASFHNFLERWVHMLHFSTFHWRAHFCCNLFFLQFSFFCLQNHFRGM